MARSDGVSAHFGAKNSDGTDAAAREGRRVRAIGSGHASARGAGDAVWQRFRVLS